MAARLFVVEDEALISLYLVTVLRRLGHEVVGTATEGLQAVQAVEELRPDLVLMDLQLKGATSGIEAAKAIRRSTGIPVIFLTAYSEDGTLDRAKVAEPLGYIVKPFTIDALRSTLEMALYKSAEEARQRIELREMAHTVTTGDRSGSLFVKDRGRNVRIDLHDILYIEAMKDYMSVHVKDRRYVVHSTLQRLLALLPEQDFFQVHRSFIIRLDKVVSVENNAATLEGVDRTIPVGRAHHARFIERIDPV